MNDRPCDVCGKPLTVGQRQRHFRCCAALGGREPLCNPIKRRRGDGGGIVCAHCWREAAA